MKKIISLLLALLLLMSIVPASAGAHDVDHLFSQVLSLRELGATPDMLDGIAEGTFLLRGGYKPDLTTGEIRQILEACF